MPNGERSPEKTVDGLLAKLYSSRDNKSYLKKYLTPNLAHCLKKYRTSYGGTLQNIILSGVENEDSEIGVFVPDAEAYDVFWPLLKDIILETHHFPSCNAIYQPRCEVNDIGAINLDSGGGHVISTRIRLARNIAGFGFSLVQSEKGLLQVEELVRDGLACLSGELEGTYTRLSTMSQATRDALHDRHLLFHNRDRFLSTAGAFSYWPLGRGVFTNADSTLAAWVNEEDHLRLISVQRGGDIGQVYHRLLQAELKLSQSLNFARSERLGYLTVCPTNLGTTLRASVHIRIPLVASLAHFEDLCQNWKLEVRGVHGEHTSPEHGVYDISNKRRLGITESEAVLDMVQGVKTLILLEKSMEAWQLK